MAFPWKIVLGVGSALGLGAFVYAWARAPSDPTEAPSDGSSDLGDDVGGDVTDPAVPYAMTLLRKFEGFRTNAYPDPASGGDPWTIGYGATGSGIGPGTIWTREQAESDLQRRVSVLVSNINAILGQSLPPQSVGALVSFAYNVGLANFKRSSLLAMINTGDARGAADEFSRWVYAHGARYEGLVGRRAGERDAYLAGLDAATPNV